MSKWLSVAYAVRALFSDITFPTLTVRPTELGSPTSVRLRLLLTDLIRLFPFAPVAFAPVRLSVLKLKKTSADASGSLFAIIDQRVPEEIENALSALDFEVIKLPECIEKESAVASHTDIVLFKAKDLVIGSQAYFEKHPSIEKKIKRAGLNIIKSEDIHSEKYPYDAIFNALVIGDRLFLKTDSASRAIIDYAGEHNLKVVRTRQGYPACTTLAIGNKHAITSDLGMARLLRDEGIAVLTVPESDKIELPP